MKVYFVGAGPGDPELLTVRADRLLRQARICIYAGSLINPDLLALLPPDAERHDSAGMSLEGIVAVFEDAGRRGVDVVRLASGEPSIYGAIGEQMDALDARGIAYEIVPGISAFQAAASALAVELTAAQVAQTVILTRSAGRTPLPASEDLAVLARSRATLCIYLSADRIDELSAMLQEHYGAECPAAVVYHAAWLDQKILRGTLRDIAEQVRASGIRRTAVFLVGAALKRPVAHVSRLYDKTFGHGYRPGVSDE
jgi:precorrin-4/cobalt-precorrin-4 C11-methyltransferase